MGLASSCSMVSSDVTHGGTMGGGGGRSAWTTVMFILSRVMIMSCVSTANPRAQTPRIQVAGDSGGGGVGDQMRTPTIQTGSVVVPKMRLRLGKWMAIKNKIRD
jgi:hypothetical protein